VAENDFEERPELDQKLSELEIMRQSIDSAKTKEKDLLDQLLRLTAEFQNFRKRSEQRIIDSRKEGRADVLLQIISLADGLVHAEKASENATDIKELKKGLTLVKMQFEKFLADQGLETIKTKGEKLDPLRHEALMQVVKEDMDEGMIVEEIQRGYTLNGHVVRPSRVSVSTRTKESASKEQGGN
jgi:molecular chaperone GrpE